VEARNKTFTILSSIGIILIILGHLNYGILEFGGLFPYYSYHVLIFVFISGYFYKLEDEDNILSFLKRKAKRLLLPYMIYNLITGIVIIILHKCGYSYGENVSLYNLIVAPFYGGHQFMLNAPGWFIPALFLLELCNVIGRKVLSLVKIRNEYLIFALYAVFGITTAILAQRGSVYEWYKVPGRLLFMAPVLQLGRLYRADLEQRDRIPNVLYFGILLILNLILICTQYGLGYSVVWVSGFNNNPVIPYVTAFTGIALWLRIAKILSGIPGDSKLINYLGKHTFEICNFHLFAWMLINGAFAIGFAMKGISTDSVMGQFKSDVYYTYLPKGIDMFKWVYFLAGIFFPLGLCFIGDKVKKLVCGLQTDGKTTK